MVLVNRVISFIVLICLVTLAIVVTLSTSPRNYENSRAYVFLTVLAGLNIFMTFFFYYGIVESTERQFNLDVTKETARLNNMFVDKFIDAVMDEEDTVPNFVASLNPLQMNTVSQPDPDTDRARLARLNLSYKIFTIWQDFMFSDDFIAIEPVSYITSFLQRANSYALLQQWKTSKIDFNDTTQEFGDLLFEYAIPIVNQTPSSYTEAAKRLVHDKRYRHIRHMV